MSKIDIKSQAGENVASKTLNKTVWNIEANDAVLYDAIILAQASLRQGTSSTKTRSEVSGGGRKPWRQKGTGNARQGSIRATQWYHGGIAFGPQPRSYKKKMNKKERRLALLSALTYKCTKKDLVVVDEIKFDSPKTTNMLKLLADLKLENEKVLLVLDEIDENVFLAGRNLGFMKIILSDSINTLDVVTANKLVMTKKALEKLEEVLKHE